MTVACRVQDPSVTRDHVRKWRILSELKVGMTTGHR